MNCLEFRRHCLTNPYETTDESRSHSETCGACARFETEIKDLDKNIYRASTVAVPEGLAAKILLNQSFHTLRRMPTRWSWLSMAASFFALIFFTFYEVSLSGSIDESVVTHVQAENQHVLSSRGQYDELQVKQVLQSIRLHQSRPLGEVVYATNCIIDGQLVAHFVIESQNRAYTLVLIPGENTGKSIKFKRKGWHGVVNPHGMGNLAVVTPESASDRDQLARIARRFAESVTPFKS